MRKILTVGQVAKKIGCSARYVAILIDSGKLPGYRLPGSNHRRVFVEDLDEFLKIHKIGAGRR